jgi:hypothetical protein
MGQRFFLASLMSFLTLDVLLLLLGLRPFGRFIRIFFLAFGLDFAFLFAILVTIWILTSGLGEEEFQTIADIKLNPSARFRYLLRAIGKHVQA